MTRPRSVLAVCLTVSVVLNVANLLFDKWVVVQTVEAANRPTFLCAPDEPRKH